MSTFRRILILLSSTLGLIALSTSSASAGLALANHCLPTTTFTPEPVPG
jgi:hypothetical protein